MEEENRSLDVEEQKGIEKSKVELVAADGSAGAQKALELMEKKRRLVLSDSEDSDNDFRVSLRQKPVSKAERNRGRQVVRKKDAVERLKREEIKGEQKKMVVSTDIQRRREEAAVVRKQALELSSEKKRRRDDTDSEIPVERIKAEPLRYARRNAEESGEKKMRTDSVKHGAVRMKTRTEKVLDSKPAIPPDKWRNGCNGSKINSTPSNLSKSCKFESAGRQNDSLNGRRMECKQSYLNKSLKLEHAERHSDDPIKSGTECKKSDSNSGSKLEAADRKKGILEERTTQSKSLVLNKLNKLEADHPCRYGPRDGRTEAEKLDLDKAVNREAPISQRDGTEEEGAEAENANSNKPSKLETADGLGGEPTGGGREANKVDSEESAKPKAASDGQRDGIEDGRNESNGIESGQSRKAEAAAIKKDDMDNRRGEDEEDILNKSTKPEVPDGGRVVMKDGRIEGKEEDSTKLSKLQMADGHAGNTVNGSIEAQKVDTEKTSNSQADRNQLHSPLDGTIACKIHSDKSSKPDAADRWRGAPVSKVASRQSKLKKSNKPEAEKKTLMERSVQKTLHVSKSRSSHFLGVKEKDCGIMKGKAIKVQGRDGLLGVMPTKKKVGGLRRSQFVREDEESGKTLLSPTAASRIVSAKHSSVSGERKVLKRSFHDSAVRQSDFGERLTAKKYGFDRVKAQSKSSSKRNPKNDSLSNANDVLSKVKSRSSKETHLLDNQQTESPSTSRGTARQKLREQLKGILLNAGWKIDLKPRRGRNYEDKVYVSPDGRGYWSITKAYTVFQQQLDSADGEEHKKFPGKSSKRSVENHNLEGPSSPVAIEVLDILKRNVVNKRRSREELEEVLTKTGNLKRRKNEKKLIEGIRRRRKPKNSLDTSTISSDDFTSRKPHILSRYSNNKRGCALLVRGANQEAESEGDDYVQYVWKRTVLSWMIDLGIVPINGVVKYMNRRRTRAMLEGRITRDGIHCNCCSKILSVAKFELHAGSKLHQPYENIFVDRLGISLLQCQLNTWEKQDVSEKKSFYTINIEGDDPNDDTCGICGDGGDLICCDGCPSTFHLSCLGIKMLPAGDWLCTNCSCKFCREASGSLTPESCESSYTLLSCSLCGEKYHDNCLPEVDAVPSNLGNACIAFCGKKCKKVFEGLQKLIGIKNELEAGFSWCLICRFDEDSSKHSCGLPQRAECNSKIAVALAVMDECFLPITDDRSGINLIHNVVYNCGSNFNRLNYSGFYTFILERGDEIISAASVRIHGTRLAEMPFIGTRNMYRRQGMCRRLLLGIESALTSLNVEKLMIPAISELTETWTTVFGFKPLDVLQRKEVRTVNILVFPGTGLLQKTLLRRDSTEHSTSSADVNVADPATEHHCIPDVANASSSASSVVTKLPASNEVNTQCKIEASETKPNLCAAGGSINSTSGLSGVYSVRPELLPPDKILVNCKYEAKDTEPDNHGCGGSVNSTSDVLSDRALRFQYEDHKPLETAADVDFSVQPELVYGKKSTEDAELLVETPDEAQVILPHDSTAHGNCKLENGESGSFLKLPCAGDTRGKSTSGDIHLSRATSASTLQDCRRSNLQGPICPLGSRRDAIHFDGSGVELGGQSSSNCIGNATCFDRSEVERGIQASSDCDGDHGTKYPIEASGFNNSEAKNGSINSTFNVSRIPPTGSRFVDCKGLQCGTHGAKAEVTAVESESHPNFSDNDNLSFKIVSRCLNVTPVNDTEISSNIPIEGQSSLDSAQENFDIEERSYTQQPNSCIIDGSKIGTEPNKSPDIKDIELTSESPDSSDAASSSEVKDSSAVVADVSIASNDKNLLDASCTSDVAISGASARLPYKMSGDSKDATSFGILNNLPSSTVIPVQHELPSDDKISSDAPAAASHICDEQGSDASVLQDSPAT